MSFSPLLRRHGRYGVLLLDVAQDDVGDGALDGGDALDLVEDGFQLGVGAGDDLDAVVVLAGEVVALEDLGVALHEAEEVVGAAGVLEADHHQGAGLLVHGDGVEYGGVLRDDAAALEFFQALAHGRKGQVDPFGELGDGDPRVLLKNFQYLDVYGVQSHNNHPVYAIMHEYLLVS